MHLTKETESLRSLLGRDGDISLYCLSVKCVSVCTRNGNSVPSLSGTSPSLLLGNPDSDEPGERHNVSQTIIIKILSDIMYSADTFEKL